MKCHDLLRSTFLRIAIPAIALGAVPAYLLALAFVTI